MGRCFGITKNLRRCSRIGDWKLFCFEHRLQPFVWLVIFVFTILAGIASMQSAWGPSSKIKPASPVNNAQVIIVEKKLILPANEDDPVRISFGLMNIGDTDATVTLKNHTFYFSTDPAQKVFKHQPNPAVEIPVLAIPNAIWRAELRFDFRLTAEKLEALKGGEARLFFYAKGEYQDATGETYSLPFAEMYDPMFPGNLVAPQNDIVFE